MPFRRFAIITLGYNLLVIVWGAYVRASGSGAGCGQHWPLCNGAVVPQSPSTATMIEYAHRITSGLALVLVVGLAIWAFRVVPPGDRLRKAAVSSLVFIITEALVGAGLVLLELVGENSSMLRAGYLAVHLTNTFCLLAALLLTVLWAPGTPERLLPMSRRPVHWVALGLVLVTGMTGAITALGDTLFPSGSLAEGLSQDQDPTPHFLIRLRVIHPILAVVTAGVAGMIGLRWQAARGERRGVPADRLFGIVAAVQVAVGLVNLLLLVPIPTQLLHLFVADLMWMAAVGVVAGR